MPKKHSSGSFSHTDAIVNAWFEGDICSIIKPYNKITMKGKYITTQILLACLSKPVEEKKELAEEPKPSEDRDNALMDQWKLKIQSSGADDDSTNKKAA